MPSIDAVKFIKQIQTKQLPRNPNPFSKWKVIQQNPQVKYVRSNTRNQVIRNLEREKESESLESISGNETD